MFRENSNGTFSEKELVIRPPLTYARFMERVKQNENPKTGGPMSEGDKCYYCGQSRCECEVKKISIITMKHRVKHAYRFGLKYDRDACTFEELRALLLKLERKTDEL